MHVAGTKVSVRKASKLTAKCGIFANTTEVLNVLARPMNIACSSKDLILSAAEILDRVIEKREDGSEESAVKCQFAAEQLRLVSSPPHCRRYSAMLMSAAMVWERTSPKLYDDLYNSGLLVLPNRETLRRLTTELSVKEGLKVGTVKYLQLRAYTARAVELAGGRVFETARMTSPTSSFVTTSHPWPADTKASSPCGQCRTSRPRTSGRSSSWL